MAKKNRDPSKVPFTKDVTPHTPLNIKFMAKIISIINDVSKKKPEQLRCNRRIVLNRVISARFVS